METKRENKKSEPSSHHYNLQSLYSLDIWKTRANSRDADNDVIFKLYILHVMPVFWFEYLSFETASV